MVLYVVKSCPVRPTPGTKRNQAPAKAGGQIADRIVGVHIERTCRGLDRSGTIGPVKPCGLVHLDQAQKSQTTFREVNLTGPACDSVFAWRFGDELFRRLRFDVDGLELPQQYEALSFAFG